MKQARRPQLPHGLVDPRSNGLSIASAAVTAAKSASTPGSGFAGAPGDRARSTPTTSASPQVRQCKANDASSERTEANFAAPTSFQAANAATPVGRASAARPEPPSGAE